MLAALCAFALAPLGTGAQNPQTVPAWDFAVDAFGAKGNGTADDTAAVQAAVDEAAKAGGGKVEFRGGAIYLVTSVNLSSGITLEGNGATVRRPDKTPGRFTRMFTTQNHPWLSDADSAPLVIRGLTLDGNRQNQGAYSKYEIEHAHLLFLMGAEAPAAQRGRLRVIVDGCTFKDSPADGVSVFTNVAAQITNCTAIECFRGGIVVTGGHTTVQVSNFTGRGVTHRSGLHWEVDGAGFGGSMATDSIVQNVLLDGDFAAGLAPGSTFIATGVVCRGPGLNVYAPGSTVQISDSMLSVGAQDGYGNRVVHPGDVTFARCRFTVSEKGEKEEKDRALAGLTVTWNISGTSFKGLRMRLIDCRFVADESVEPADTTYAIYTTPDVLANDNRLFVEGGEVSKAFDYALHVTQGGRAVLKGTALNAATGVYWGIAKDFSSDLEVDGATSSGATFMHIGSSDRESTLTQRNLEMDEAQSGIGTTYGIGANTYRGGRILYVESSPLGRVTGLAGDRARLKAPLAGHTCEWVCVASGLPAAVSWKPVAAVGE